MLVFTIIVKEVQIFLKRQLFKGNLKSQLFIYQLKQNYPNFGLTYFYEYKFPNGSSEWSKDNIFGPKEAEQWEF